MRQALITWNGDEVVKNHKYIMRMTGDDAQGKTELDNFILPESIYPVIATTSRLLNTGVESESHKHGVCIGLVDTLNRALRPGGGRLRRDREPR